MFHSNLRGSTRQPMVPSLIPLCPDLDLTFSPSLLITYHLLAARPIVLSSSRQGSVQATGATLLELP